MDKKAQTTRPIHPLLADRWSPRAITEQQVTDEDLGSLLEAARWAASCFNEQPWRFLFARRQDGEEFERMLGCLVEGNRGWAKAAQVLMITVAGNTFSHNGKPNRHAIHDVGLAVGNLCAQATDLGLSLHQMAGFDVEKTREVYGIPVGFDPVTAIAIGYRGDASTLPDPLRERELAPRVRKPLAELVFRGGWGKPAGL